MKESARLASHESLVRFLDEVKDRCGLTNNDLSGIMGHAYTGNVRALPINSFTRVLDHFNVGFDSIVFGTIDYEVLTQHFSKGPITLPAKYVTGQNSSTRFTSAYMLDYVRTNMGENAATAVMRRLQLHPELLSNFGERNNILLPRDICSYVAHFYGPASVEKMGGHSLHVLREKLAALRLDRCRNFHDYLVRFFYEIIPGQVEKNYAWSISKLSEDEIIITATPTQMLSEAFALSEVCTVPLERLRLGFIKAITAYYSTGYVVEQISGISRGNSADRYKIVANSVHQSRMAMFH